MRYDNSLTSNVHNYIAETLAKKIQAAQSGMELGRTARDIRSYLCDQSTLSTPDFVIRRFLQARQSAILPDNVDVPNLLENKNIPWPVEVLNPLSTSLAKFPKTVEQKSRKNLGWHTYPASKNLKIAKRYSGLRFQSIWMWIQPSIYCSPPI